ncbi:TlpA family protein disulfide reductase [Amycolatopsis vastitatis]|uniref:Alkyl hydroperoxide reductase n=1 Tax=Amycolatopsis vastitatis TaxID=1905142 RepID=A0A229T0X2_9PSEU|nr:TlpA disulfide reductase family protein [Amycolatopsis vastitatis]OXM64551.1 alkyl hydroperoxide reductase [Amycolatopsis vastitatis]
MLLGRLLVVVALLAPAACSTGKDAVGAPDTFEFVSPGGQTHLFYEAGQRKRVAELAGPDVADPARQVSLGDYAGKVVLLNLWGAWCPPCRSEARTLKAISERGKSEGVAVLGLNVRDNRQYAADFVRNFELGYASIFDESGRIALRLRGLPLAAVPISLIVDKRQRVAAVYIGEVLEEDLRPTLDRVRAE